MKSSLKSAFFTAVLLLLCAATAQAARVDMTDPRRALGREDDIRVDAQLVQTEVSTSSPLSITYQVENLTESPIAIAPKVTDATYDEDSRTINVSIGAEVPADDFMPRVAVILPGEKKTFSAGAMVRITATNAAAKFGMVPRFVQIRVSVLRDIAPFRELIAQQVRAQVKLPSALFDTWLDANDTILLNPIPVRWSGKSGGGVSADQRTPAAAGTW
jgi:hypothetical protein